MLQTNIKNMVGVLIIALAAIIVMSCSKQTTVSEVEETVTKPILVGLVYDLSISVKYWSPLDSLSLWNFAMKVAERGGIVAVGTITEKSYQPLLRYPLFIDLVPVEGPLSERALKNELNEKTRAEFEKVIDQFVNEVLDKVVISRDRPYTDIAGALRRFEVFFNEPNFVDYEKILIILSDGKDTVSRHITDIPDAAVWTVGWPSTSAKQVFGDRVLIFESLDGVVEYMQ